MSSPNEDIPPTQMEVNSPANMPKVEQSQQQDPHEEIKMMQDIGNNFQSMVPSVERKGTVMEKINNVSPINQTTIPNNNFSVMNAPESPNDPVPTRLGQSSINLEAQNMPNDDILRNMLQEGAGLNDSTIQPDENRDSTHIVPQGVLDPNQSIKMLCDRHKAPAVFFSQKEDRYVCFKCLVAQEKLLYIDKGYKEQMDEFERIRDLTSEAIKSNLVSTSTIKTWKQEIRTCLMKIRTKFNDLIDKFIYQFGTVFKNVEMSNELLEFKGEDKKMTMQIQEMEKKYIEIVKVFNNIMVKSAKDRIDYIDNIKGHMSGIEKKVKEQDIFIKQQTKKLKDALNKTVSLENIDEKMEVKLIRFFNKELRKTHAKNQYPQQRNPTNLDDTQAIFSDIQYRNSDVRLSPNKKNLQNQYYGGQFAGENRILDSMDLSAIEDFHGDPGTMLEGDIMSSLGIQGGQSQQQMLQNNLVGRVQQAAHAQQQKSNLPSKIKKYNHKGMNSLYWLNQKSQYIYLLDFKQQRFVKEKIDSKISLPQFFSSCQVAQGNIYIVGGIQNDKVLKQTFELTEQLVLRQVASMNQGRFQAPIKLLNERFILAAGGITTIGPAYKDRLTNHCEILDIKQNNWFEIAPMEYARSSTSLCAYNNRHVFIFHGLAQSANPSQYNTIEYIDFGNLDANSFKLAKWTSIAVKSQEFIITQPRGSAFIPATNEILVFGGNNKMCFYIDTSFLKKQQDHQDMPQGWAQRQLASTPLNITQYKGVELMSTSSFCYESDFAVRQFGNYLYAVDGSQGNLHVYSTKDKQWNFSKLEDLGVQMQN